MNSFETLVDNIKDRLIDYLHLNNISWNGKNIKCLNPSHDEKNPSMGMISKPGNKLLHCFTCGASYNIFHIANILKNKPLRGTGFVTITVPELCQELNISYNPEDLVVSSENIAIREYRELYEMAADTINEISEYKYTIERGWSEKLCKDNNVGIVDWDKFKNRLCEKGKYTVEYLIAHEIDSRIFNKDSLVFTVRDKYGNTIGFAGRRINYIKGGEFPKFVNTSGRVPIYKKGANLYGYHIAIKHPQERIDVYEGYGDWLTAQQAGLKNCVAICGTEFTDSHIALLKDAGFTHINLVLDSDVAGIDKMKTFLHRFSTAQDVRITVMVIPFEDSQPLDQRDPDDFIREYGLKDYLAIKPQTLFDWRFEELKQSGLDPKEMTKTLIPCIVAETSPILQGEMCSRLAALSDISEEDIRAEVKLRSNKIVKDISETAISKLRAAKDSLEIVNILDKTINRIKQVTNKKDLSLLHITEPLRHFEKWFNDAQTTQQIANTWKTGWGIFDNPVVLGGIKKKESIILLAGSPNHGKSSLLINIARKILDPINSNNNLSLLLWSLDDSRNVTWNKLISSMCKMSTLNTGNPYRKIYNDPMLKNNYNNAYEFLKGQISSQRLVVKGTEIGNNLESLETWIKHVQDTTGNNILLFIDAINDMKTGDPSTDSNERIKYIELYNWMQQYTEKLQFSLATVCHVTKAGISKGKPCIDDISESGKAIYAAKAIGMVYSKLDDKSQNKDNCTTYWNDTEDMEAVDTRKPIIELDIQKNKETAFKGQLWFKHKPECVWIEEMSSTEVRDLRLNNAAIDSDDQLEFGERQEEFKFN